MDDRGGISVSHARGDVTSEAVNGWHARPDWPWLLSAVPRARLQVADIDEVAGRTRGRLVYLATPYSLQASDGRGWCPALAALPAADAAAWVARLARRGVTAVSPVLQSHHACLALPGLLDPLDAAFWQCIDAPLLHAAGALVIPPVPGWQASLGIWHETGVALARGTPVWLIAEGA